MFLPALAIRIRIQRADRECQKLDRRPTFPWRYRLLVNNYHEMATGLATIEPLNRAATATSPSTTNVQ
jgi:hypothetical protein